MGGWTIKQWCLVLARSALTMGMFFLIWHDQVHGRVTSQHEQIHEWKDKTDEVVERIASMRTSRREKLFLQAKEGVLDELFREYSSHLDALSSEREREELEIKLKQRLKLHLDQVASRQKDVEGTLGRQGWSSLKERKEHVKNQLSKNHKKRVLIRSIEEIDSIEDKFRGVDETVELQKLSTASGVHIYEVLSSGEIEDEIDWQIDQGVFPEELLGEEVIFPDVLEVQQLSFHGEDLSQAWGVHNRQAMHWQSVLQDGNTVTVGVIDTGIDTDHPDIQGGISQDITGKNFIDDGNTDDVHGHGTHVAGVIGARVNGQGLFGVNSAVDLVPLKICDEQGLCPTYALYDALVYAADQGVDVVNVSLGGRGDPTTSVVCDAIAYAVGKGVIPVVAAANANSEVNGYVPGGCAETITVGAVDTEMRKASFSNYGTGVEFSAPGVGILSTVPGGGYRVMDGTSMATPHIAGLVSAMKAVDSTLGYHEIVNRMRSGALPVESEKVMGLIPNMGAVMDSLGVAPQLSGWCKEGAEWLGSSCSSTVKTIQVDETVTYQSLVPGSGTGLALQVLPHRLTIEVGEVGFVSVQGGDPNTTAYLQGGYLGLGHPSSSSIRVTEQDRGIQIVATPSEEEIRDWGDEGEPHQAGEPFETLTLVDASSLQVQQDLSRAVAVWGNQPGEYEFLVYDVQGNKQHIPVTVTHKVLYVQPDTRYFFPHTPWYTMENIMIPSEGDFLRKRVCYSSLCGRGQYGGGETFGFDVYRDGVSDVSFKLRNKVTGGYQTMTITIVAGAAEYAGPGVDTTRPPPNWPADQLRVSEEEIRFNRGQRKKLYVGGGTPPYTHNFVCDNAIGHLVNESSVATSRKTSDEQSLVSERTRTKRKQITRGTSGNDRSSFTNNRSQDVSGQTSVGVASTSDGAVWYYDMVGTYYGSCSVTIRDSSGLYKRVWMRVENTPLTMQPGDELIVEGTDWFDVKDIVQYANSPFTVSMIEQGKFLIQAISLGSKWIKFTIDKYRGSHSWNNEDTVYTSISVTSDGEPTWSYLQEPWEDTSGEETSPLRVSHEVMLLHPGDIGTIDILGGTPPYTVTTTVSSSMVLESGMSGSGLVTATVTDRGSAIEVLGMTVGSQAVTIEDAHGASVTTTIKTLPDTYQLDADLPLVFHGSDVFGLQHVISQDESRVVVQESVYGAGWQLIPLQTGQVSIETVWHHYETGQEIPITYQFDVIRPVEELPDLPPLAMSHDSLRFRVGESIDLWVSQGIPPYEVLEIQGNGVVGFGYTARGEEGVALEYIEDLLFSGDVSFSETFSGAESVTVDASGIVSSGIDQFEIFPIDIQTGTDSQDIQSSSRFFRGLALQPGEAVIRVKDAVGRRGDIPVTVTDHALELRVGTTHRLVSSDRYRIERVQTSHATLLPVTYVGGGEFEVTPAIHGEATLRVTIYNEHQQQEQRLVYPISIVNDGGDQTLQPIPEDTSPPVEEDMVGFSLSDETIEVGSPVTVYLTGGGTDGYEIVLGSTGFAIIGEQGSGERVRVSMPDGRQLDVYIQNGMLELLPIRAGATSISVRSPGVSTQTTQSQEILIEQKTARILHGTQLLLPYHDSYQMLSFTSTNPDVFQVTQTAEGYLMEAVSTGQASALIGFLDTAEQIEKSYEIVIDVVDTVQDVQEVTVYIDPEKEYSLFLEEGVEYTIEHNGVIGFYDVPGYLYAKEGGHVGVASENPDLEIFSITYSKSKFKRGLKILVNSENISGPPVLKIIKGGVEYSVNFIIAKGYEMTEQPFFDLLLLQNGDPLSVEEYVSGIFAHAMDILEGVSVGGTLAWFSQSFDDQGHRDLKSQLVRYGYTTTGSSMLFNGEYVTPSDLGNVMYGYLGVYKGVYNDIVGEAYTRELMNYRLFYGEEYGEVRAQLDETTDQHRYRAGKQLYEVAGAYAESENYDTFLEALTTQVINANVLSHDSKIAEEEGVLEICRQTNGTIVDAYACGCQEIFDREFVDDNNDGMVDEYLTIKNNENSLLAPERMKHDEICE